MSREAADRIGAKQALVTHCLSLPPSPPTPDGGRNGRKSKRLIAEMLLELATGNRVPEKWVRNCRNDY